MAIRALGTLNLLNQTSFDCFYVNWIRLLIFVAAVPP